MLKYGLASALTYLITLAPAYAAPQGGRPPGGGLPPWAPAHGRPVAVPEIDASAGLLAIATVATVILFVWERRRRARQAD